MIQAVIFIVLASIIFNWLYKKEDLVRKIGYYLLQVALLVTSIVALALGGLKPIFIVYFALMIASSLSKLVVNEDVEHRACLAVAKRFTYKVEPTLALECQLALTLFQYQLLQAFCATS